MPVEVTIPRLGWSMEEGTFRAWLKAAGDAVRPGEMLFALEGEKAAQDIESFDAGVLFIPADAPRPGDVVKVGQVIGFLLAEGESPPPARRSSKPVSTPPAEPVRAPQRPAGPAARRLARQLGIDLDTVPTPDPTGRVVCEDVRRAAHPLPTTSTRAVATPRARRRARDLKVDWTNLTGTGRDGRIRERDVLAASSTPAAPTSTIRQVIARRMLAGTQQTAPVTLTTKADASALVALRTQWKANASGGVVPSYTDMIVKLVATALPECPHLNACWDRDGVLPFEAINVAVAVDTEFGLVAPVIANADRLSLAELSARSRELIAQARAGTLSQSGLQDGTFTVTSLGTFDIDFFTPVINLPQSAILGVGRIVREPVVRGDAVVPGETIGLSLTFDHRVLDGAPAARWLQRLSQMIRQPAEALHHT